MAYGKNETVLLWLAELRKLIDAAHVVLGAVDDDREDDAYTDFCQQFEESVSRLSSNGRVLLVTACLAGFWELLRAHPLSELTDAGSMVADQNEERGEHAGTLHVAPCSPCETAGSSGNVDAGSGEPLQENRRVADGG